MRIKHMITAAALVFAASTVTAATTWAPTNTDTDFIQLELPGIPDAFPGIETNGGILALFDDSDFGGNALVIGQNGGHVVFSDNLDGSWNAEVFDIANTSGGSITLSDNYNFKLGVDWGAGYFGDTNASLLSSPDTYLIVFDGFDAQDRPRSGATLAVDLAPIPVPAAVWLFGSGLLGLVAVARRRV